MLWVHQRIRAHLPGQRERTGTDIGTYHFRRAQRFYRANNQAADRANAGDKDAFALQIARLMSRMYGNRQRLGKGHGFFVRLFRPGNALSGIDSFKSGKTAIDMRKIHGAAKETHFSTVVFFMLQTVFAMTARLRWINRYRLSFS